MSFAAKIHNSRALIYDMRWQADDEAFFAILEIDKPKHDAFKRALEEKRDDVDLRVFGTVLYSGTGEPSDAIKAECREKYSMYMNE